VRGRLLAAAIAATSFGFPLAWSLSTTIPLRTTQPLAVTANEPLVPVRIPELTYLRTRGGQSTYRVRLAAAHVTKLLEQPEVRLRVTDYGKTRTVLSAAIASAAGNCGYAARTGERFPNSGVLVFFRRESCATVPDDAQHELVLTVQLDEPGPIGVWTTQRGKPNESEVEILLADRGVGASAGRAIAGSVGYTDTSRGRSRLGLLTYVWQVSPSPWWLIVLTISAVALVATAAFLLTDAHVLAGEIGRRSRLYSALGAFSVALALVIVYASVTPPFQAADESHHFAGLAAFLRTPGLGGEANLLAQKGHFDRIRFNHEEHFSPSDVGHPEATLTTGIVPDSDLRGRGVLAVWDVFARFLRGHNVGTTLLLARVLNGIVFAIAVGLFVYLVAVFSPNRWPILDAFPLFIIPTLPFFGMQVSNYAPLCAVYVVLAGAVMLFVWDGRRSYAAGPIMGSTWAVATLLSRSAVPLAPLLACCAAARAVLGPRRTSVPAAFVFWLGLTLPGAIGLWLIPQRLIDLARSTTDGVRGSRAMWGLVDHPWVLIVIGMAASAGELWFHRNRRDDGDEHHGLATQLTRALAYAAAVVVGISIAVSAFVEYPLAPVIDRSVGNYMSGISTGKYLTGMLLAGMTMFRLSRPNSLSQSFWSGFGWLDTPLPDWTVIALAAGTGVALSVTLVWIGKSGACRTGVYVLLIVASLVGAFLVSAFFVLSIEPIDLHGRYLLGIYLCVIALSWHCLPRLIEKAGWHRRIGVLGACGLAVIIIHGVAFATILRRYFG
jgi:hypothetical protein